MQLDQLEILSYMHQPETVSSNTCSQVHVQIKHFLAHLQDLIPTLAGVITYIYHFVGRSKATAGQYILYCPRAISRYCLGMRAREGGFHTHVV